MNAYTWISVMTAIAMVTFDNHVQADSENGACKDEDGNEHLDGSSYLGSNGCNRCFCNNGIIGCTEMACLPPQGCNYKGYMYIPGQNFNDDCNTCICGENGEVGCTRMSCPPSCNYKGVAYAVGQAFKDDCNTCSCAENGVVGCTKMACPPIVCTYGEATYAVGDSFVDSDGCNNCSCTSSGLVACTMKMCLPAK